MDSLSKKKNKKTPFSIPTPENADKCVSGGISPETFLTDYNYDESTRSVISFRKANIRDIQIGDFCEFADGKLGLIAGMYSLPVINHAYNNGYTTNIFNKKIANISTEKELYAFNFDIMNPNSLQLYNAVRTKQTNSDFLFDKNLIVMLFKYDDSFGTCNIQTLQKLNSYKNGRIQYCLEHYSVNDVVKIYKNTAQLFSK